MKKSSATTRRKRGVRGARDDAAVPRFSRNVLTQHNDAGRTGHFPFETKLDWTNVNAHSFGKLFDLPVDGFVFAQPLHLEGVEIKKGNPVDLVIVATMRNMVYAFEAASGSASCVWQCRLGEAPAVPSNAFGREYTDLYHSEVGILSTPVIDPATMTLYAVAMTFDAATFDAEPEAAFAHHLHAVDVRTGREIAVQKIHGRYPGKGYLAPNGSGKARREAEAIVLKRGIPVDRVAATSAAAADEDVRETRPWPVQDGAFVDGHPHVVFNSMMQLQRPGLLLVDGLVYSAYGSHGDEDPYHGWIFAHDAATLEPMGAFCTSANGSKAGIWQAGEGLVADEEGFVYAGTGNGDTAPSDGTYGECLLRLRHDGEELRLAGFANVFEDPSGGDDDFGASSPTLLRDGLMIGGGKDGNFFLFDSRKMTTQYADGSLRQVFLASYDIKAYLDGNATHHIHGAPAVFDKGAEILVFVWGENDFLRCFRYDPRSESFPGQPNERNMPGRPAALGAVRASADNPRHNGMPGGFLSISSDGARGGTGIVWASFPPYGDANQSLTRGELRAFKADDIEEGRLVSLWSSRCNRLRDDFGIFPKFVCPTVVGGRVFQPTANNPGTVAVYGHLLKPDGGYWYAISGKTGLRLDGAAYVRDGKVHLTEVGWKAATAAEFDDPGNRRRGPHASTCFLAEPVPLATLDTSFTFVVGDYPRSDGGRPRPETDREGFTFCVCADGIDIVGGAGSGFGYGPDVYSKLDRGARIPRSYAIAFGLTNNTIGLRTDGATPGPQDPQTAAGANLRSGQRIRVTISNHSERLVVTLLPDALAEDQQPIEHAFDEADLTAHVGEKGFIGLTAATGESNFTLVIEDWERSTLTPREPVDLAAANTVAAPSFMDVPSDGP